MDPQKLYAHIDRQLEKLVFMFAANEGIDGIWEFVHEISHYNFLTIADKYAITYDLLKESILEGLLVLEEFADGDLTQKIKDVDLTEIESILNRPTSWYPGYKPVYSVTLTKKGEKFLDITDKSELQKLNDRLFGYVKK